MLWVLMIKPVEGTQNSVSLILFVYLHKTYAKIDGKEHKHNFTLNIFANLLQYLSFSVFSFIVLF